MSPDDWMTAAKICGAAIVGGFFAIKLHMTEKNSKKAEIYSKPTGNGFASEVKDALTCLQASAAEQKNATERIELRQSQDSTMLYDHIKAHANADVLKGARNESPSDPHSP